MFKRLGKWGMNILIATDQLINAFRFGDPDETVSSTIGKMKVKNNGKVPWSRPVVKLVDYGLELIDPGHSIDAIDLTEGKDAVFAGKKKPKKKVKKSA